MDWRLENSNTWTQAMTLQVKGIYQQPSQDQAFGYFDTFSALGIPGNPWFLRWVPLAEQIALNAYSQFDTSGNPVFGPPHGYGFMQLDPPTGSYVPVMAILYNWQRNIDAARDRAETKGYAALSYTQNLGAAALDWYNNNPGNPLPIPDDIPEGICTFSASVPDQSQDLANHRFPSWHVNWVKSYNSGYYLKVDSSLGIYYIEPNNSGGFDYVNRVCTKVQ